MHCTHVLSMHVISRIMYIAVAIASYLFGHDLRYTFQEFITPLCLVYLIQLLMSYTLAGSLRIHGTPIFSLWIRGTAIFSLLINTPIVLSMGAVLVHSDLNVLSKLSAPRCRSRYLAFS